MPNEQMPTFGEFFVNSERNRIKSDLDSAAKLGDSKRVIELSDQLAALERDFGAKRAPAALENNDGGQQQPSNKGAADEKLKGVDWTPNDARKALSEIAPWYGSDPDPERMEYAHKVAGLVDITKYPKVADYAAKIKELVEKKFPPEQTAEEDDDDENEGDVTDDDDENAGQQRQTQRRKPTPRQQPSGVQAPAGRAGAGPAGKSKLSDITSKKDREVLRGMITRQKLDEKTVVGNYFKQQEAKKKAQNR